MDYIFSAIERATFEIVIMFGGVFALATMLWFASQQLRGDGYSRFGRAYVYFVAPGVICHETGHALGCILTGTRIVEFVPFRLSGNELGHVTHECRQAFFGRIADFFIGTGPVWFGCLMIFLLARLLGGRELLDRLSRRIDFSAELDSSGFGLVLSVGQQHDTVSLRAPFSSSVRTSVRLGTSVDNMVYPLLLPERCKTAQVTALAPSSVRR